MRVEKVATALIVGALALGGVAGCNATSGGSGSDSGSAPAAAASEKTLALPTDFTFDPETGAFSFTANDENAGYYYVRVYALRDGKEAGDVVSSSDRIAGSSTGEKSGKVDLSALGYGDYHVDLVTYPAAGTDYESPEDVVLTLQSGVGGKLERPEMLAMVSGNQVELVLDWWTLCDYNTLQYLPQVKFTFYSDEGLTQVVDEQTVDTYELLGGMKKNPPGTGYIWGEARDASVVRLHKSNGELTSFMGGPVDPSKAAWGYVNDIYPFTLEPGTYYVTAQAISAYDYVADSDPSTPIEFTLTDAEPSSEFTEGMTELYIDPSFDGSSVTAAPNQQEGRVDAPAQQTTSRSLAE